jgi:hypothetical protein
MGKQRRYPVHRLKNCYSGHLSSWQKEERKHEKEKRKGDEEKKNDNEEEGKISYLPPASTLGLFFYPEDRGDMFARNVSLL